MTTPSFWQAGVPDQVVADPLPRHTAVAVLGGGLLGCAAAYWLARSGADVTLFEQGALASGATGRNGGFVVAGTAALYHEAIATLGHQAARSVWRLTLRNRTLLRDVLAEEQIACDYREPGHLTLATSPAHQLALGQAAVAMAADGFGGELYDRPQVAQLLGLALGEQVVGGLFMPENALLHSVRLVQGLAGAARRHGARLCIHTPVQQIVPAGDGVLLHSAAGTTRADALIVATNAWLGHLVPALAPAIMPVRGQVLAYAPLPPQFRVGVGAALSATGEYWQQAPDGTIILGGCRAAATGHDVGLLSGTSAEVQQALEAVLPTLFPDLQGLRVVRRWGGPMAFTPDHTPVADALPGLRQGWFVGGFSGHGMPFGMVLGKLLAEAATAGHMPAELHPLRLSRSSLQARG